MAGKKKSADAGAPAKKGSGQAKIAAKDSAAVSEALSKRICQHCGEPIPLKKILVVQVISYAPLTNKQSRRNEYYNRDHRK